MKTILLAAMLLMALATPAMAKGRCYGADEMKAEQLLRLHSEMMVVAVTCHYGSDGRDLGRTYAGFTRTNIKTFHDAEQVMTRYYEASYGGDGTERLDRLRTRLANEFGQISARQSAPAFCAERRDRVGWFANASPQAVEREAMAQTHATYDPPCDSRLTVARKN